MQGRLEHVELDMDEVDLLSEFNLAAAQGKEFVLLRKPDGNMMGLHLRNILTFEEVDQDAELLG